MLYVVEEQSEATTEGGEEGTQHAAGAKSRKLRKPIIPPL
jgi:hypothetical protein